MYIYVLMIIVSMYFAFLFTRSRKKTDKRILFFLSIIPPVLVSAFRYNNGADYLMYMDMFERINQGIPIISFRDKKIEVGFVQIVKISQIISVEHWFIFGILAFIICIFFWRGSLLNSDNFFQSIVLFYITGVFFESFDGIRQYIAAAIFCLSLKYILVVPNFKKYLLCLVIAFFFHKSAIFLIPVYFVKFITIDWKKTVFITSITLVGSTFIFELVKEFMKFTPYAYFLFSQEFNEAVANQSTILFFSVNTCIGYYFARDFQVNFRTKVLLNIQVISLCVSLMTMFIPLFSRVLIYFKVTQLFFIPHIVLQINKKMYKKMILYIIYVMYIMVNLYGIYYNDWYQCLPYNFYFDYM